MIEFFLWFEVIVGVVLMCLGVCIIARLPSIRRQEMETIPPIEECGEEVVIEGNKSQVPTYLFLAVSAIAFGGLMLKGHVSNPDMDDVTRLSDVPAITEPCLKRMYASHAERFMADGGLSEREVGVLHRIARASFELSELNRNLERMSLAPLGCQNVGIINLLYGYGGEGNEAKHYIFDPLP